MAAALIAKAILGGIGGGLEKAGDASKTSIAKGSSSSEKKEEDTGSQIGSLIGNLGKKFFAKKEEKGESDLNLKSIYPDITDELIEAFGMINPIAFKYKPEAQELYKNEDKGVDDKMHVGVKAQELEANPITSGTVNTDEHGFKEVDTRHLTFANTAMISELCRKVEELENVVKGLRG